MELDESLNQNIQALSQEGERHYEAEAYEQAVTSYLAALALVPNPKEDWEASLWLYAALGDAFFKLKRYEESLGVFRSAEKCQDGLDNAYVVLMIGQNYYELHNKHLAREYLLKAYMLEGEEIFEEQDQKYFETIEDLV